MSGDAASLLWLYTMAAAVLILPGIGATIWQRYYIRRAVDPVPASISLLWLKKLGYGLAAGCGLLLLTVIPGLAAGAFSPSSPGWQAYDAGAGGAADISTGGLLLLFILQSVSEELHFRAIYLGLLGVLFLWLLRLQGLGCAAGGRMLRPAAWLGAGIAASAAVSVAFAQSHAANPNVSLLALVNIALAGLLLGLVAWVDGDIWGAWGLHFAWNTSQALLGLPVSGMADLSSGPFTGAVPGLLTGGAFGPEASLPASLALSLGAAGVLGLAARRLKPQSDPPADEKPATGPDGQ